MHDELKEVIAGSTFEVMGGSFVYAQARSLPEPGQHFMVTHDHDEITVVTERAQVGRLDLIARNKDDYSLIALNVSKPFYCVGFIAAVSDAIAKHGLNLLVVSTFSKDYVMVREEDLAQAREALIGVGFHERSGGHLCGARA